VWGHSSGGERGDRKRKRKGGEPCGSPRGLHTFGALTRKQYTVREEKGDHRGESPNRANTRLLQISIMKIAGEGNCLHI